MISKFYYNAIERGQVHFLDGGNDPDRIVDGDLYSFDSILIGIIATSSNWRYPSTLYYHSVRSCLHSGNRIGKYLTILNGMAEVLADGNIIINRGRYLVAIFSNQS